MAKKKVRGPDHFPVVVRAERGTPLWAINFLRRRVLVALVTDLKRLGNRWFADEASNKVYCGHVRKALDSLVKTGEQLGGAGFLRELLTSEFREFARIYYVYNEDLPEFRQQALMQLQRQRDRIAAAVRKNQRQLTFDLTQDLTKQLYDAVRNLDSHLEGRLESFRRSIRDFDREATRIGA